MKLVRAVAVAAFGLALILLVQRGEDWLFGPAHCNDDVVVPPNAVKRFCEAHGGSTEIVGRTFLILPLFGALMLLAAVFRAIAKRRGNKQTGRLH